VNNGLMVGFDTQLVTANPPSRRTASPMTASVRCATVNCLSVDVNRPSAAVTWVGLRPASA
jgi:hypothetical protein